MTAPDPGSEKRDTIRAPWTADQAASLNEFQASGAFHPFTCGNRGDGRHRRYGSSDLGELVATMQGWRCRDCDYTQDWALASMTDREMVQRSQQFLRDLARPDV